MKGIIRCFVNVVQIISFVSLVILIIIGYIYDAIGYAKLKKLFSLIGLSNVLEYYWIIGVIMLLLLAVTCFIKTKIFTN